MKKSLLLLILTISISQVFSQSKLKDIASKANNSIFTILVYDSTGKEIDKGCGFFINNQGLAIGRAHIFRNAYKAHAVLSNGKKLRVKNVVSIDYLSNSALFRVKKKTDGFSFYNDEYVTPSDDEEVLILENIGQKDSKLDLGKLKRVVKIAGFGELTQLEQEIEDGSDGCPVINREGKLIGIASKERSSSFNYSINYQGLPFKTKALIDFEGEKKLPGDRKTKFPPLRSFTSVYVSILKGEYEIALKEVQSHLLAPSGAIQDLDDKRAVLFLRAFIEKKLRRFGDARKSYTEILELKVDDEIAFLERAKLKVKMGELESAGIDLEESLASTEKNQALVKKLQGDLFYKLDDIDKADKLYLTAHQMGYKEYDLFRERSKIYIKKELFDKAKELITQSIIANPYEPELYVLRGEINAALGKNDEATEDFDRSIKMGNTDVSAYKVMARTNLKMGNNEEAIRNLEDAVKINAEDADILLLRGQSFNEIRAYGEAKVNLDLLIKNDPFNAEAYYERGKSHIALNMMNEALRDFTKAINLNPDYTGAYLDRGVAFGLIGKFNQAIEDFSNVVTLDPKNEQGFYNLGLAQYQVKNRVAACRAWTESSKFGHESSEEMIEKYCSPKNFNR